MTTVLQDFPGLQGKTENRVHVGLPVPKERRANQGCKERQACRVHPESKGQKDFQVHQDFLVRPGKPDCQESKEKGALMALMDSKGS